MNDNEHCQRGKKIESLLWLPGQELQELIVSMVMRPSRQQMLTCLYNPNPTNKFLPQKLWGMSWHPGDGDRPGLSHMPPARAIVKKKRREKSAYYDNKVVCCLWQWLYGTSFTILQLLNKKKKKRNIWFFIQKHFHWALLTTYLGSQMFSICYIFCWKNLPAFFPLQLPLCLLPPADLNFHMFSHYTGAGSMFSSSFPRKIMKKKVQIPTGSTV